MKFSKHLEARPNALGRPLQYQLESLFVLPELINIFSEILEFESEFFRDCYDTSAVAAIHDVAPSGAANHQLSEGKSFSHGYQ